MRFEIISKLSWFFENDDWDCSRSAKFDMLNDSFDVMICEFLVNISLDKKVREANVKNDEMNWFWECCSRARKIWSTRFNDESLFERVNLRLANCAFEVVKFLNDFLEWFETKLNDKSNAFSSKITAFLNSNRFIVQNWDHLFSSINWSRRVRIDFEVIDDEFWHVTFVINDFVFIAIRSKNLCSIRRKSLNWK
jgi:hypothetical protein